MRQVAAKAPQRNCISLRAVRIGRPTGPAEKYFSSIEEKLTSDYAGMFREPGVALKHPFLTPGSDQYGDVLWEAEELAAKTVELFGRDLERFGALQEYYQPENGKPILNRGLQNWNYLVLNMIEWLKGNTPIAEFGMHDPSAS